jgi:hypothetical protein
VTAASGGNESTLGGNTIHEFTISETGDLLTFSEGGSDVDFLVVAGGGSGGTGFYHQGGGGGGGEVVESFSQTVTASSYTITVGAGSGPMTSATQPGNGGNSTVSGALSITAYGGGVGGPEQWVLDPTAGGSAGGRGSRQGTSLAAGLGVNVNAGGSSIDSSSLQGQGAGGGGGAGGAGGDAPANGARIAGAGGAGLQSTIGGTSARYGVGGNGAGESVSDLATVTTGGAQGGAWVSGSLADDGQPDTGGGGGGGGRYATGGASGAGADGIVIVSYPTAGSGPAPSGGYPVIHRIILSTAQAA